MQKSSSMTAFVVVGLVLGTVGGAVISPTVGATDSSAGSATLVVAADGNGDYESIQSAVDAASGGDTVEVRPGTYAEELKISKSITLVAHEGATLNGSTLGKKTVGVTIPAGSNAEPVIDGFTITEYGDGVVADETTGAWTIRNVSISNNKNDGLAAGKTTGAWSVRDTLVLNNGDEGIDAENTAGSWTVQNVTIRHSKDDGMDLDGKQATADWTIRNSTIRQSGDDGLDTDNTAGSWTIDGSIISGSRAAIQAINTSGDWTISNSVIRNNSKVGINGLRASGDWTVENSSFQYNRLTAISGAGATGDWTVRDTTIQNSSVGVHAQESTGDWTITNTSIQDLPLPRYYLNGQGTGVFAYKATGNWEVHNSSITGADAHALNATDSKHEGDATRNWWGSASGASDSNCVGAVDCGEELSEPPVVAEPPKVAFNAQQVTTAVKKDSMIPVPGFGTTATLVSLLLGVVLLVSRRRKD